MNGYNYFDSIYPVGNKGTILSLGKNSKCSSIFSMPKNKLKKSPLQKTSLPLSTGFSEFFLSQ